MNDRDNAAEKTAIAAHLYIALRRKINRVIDVEWLIRNEDYAREIITLGRRPGLEELSAHINRLEELVFGKPVVVPVEPPPKAMTEADELEGLDLDTGVKQYIGTLR
ncbi:MAG TPA: hypothetical protein VD810_01565 [Methylophilaceae bacterium]|nr:hypothetical protein [Methylophilaceae bacterium]